MDARLVPGTQGRKKPSAEVAGWRKPLQNLGWTTNLIHLKVMLGKISPTAHYQSSFTSEGWLKSLYVFCFCANPQAAVQPLVNCFCHREITWQLCWREKNSRNWQKNSRCQNMLGFLLPEKRTSFWEELTFRRVFETSPFRAYAPTAWGTARKPQWIAQVFGGIWYYLGPAIEQGMTVIPCKWQEEWIHNGVNTTCFLLLSIPSNLP